MTVHDPITGRTWLNSDEAAAYLGKTRRWLKRQVEADPPLVPFHKRGHTNMFLLGELEEYEDSHYRQPRQS